MRIKNSYIPAKDLDRVIERLDKMPTGFDHRGAAPTQEHFSLKKGAFYVHALAGGGASRRWESQHDPKALARALTYYEDAIHASQGAGDAVAEINALTNYSLLCLSANDYPKSVDALEKAVAINRENGFDDLLYITGTLLYCALSDDIAVKTRQQLTEDAEALRPKLEPLRKLIAATNARNNEPINPQAYRVEQGEVGLSAECPIGTDNVQDCVCVILHDPITKKTALAHVDAATDIASLEMVLERMPTRTYPDPPLQARLIGARFKESASVSPDVSDSATGNIKKIAEFLDHRRVEVQSASVRDLDQPTSIVVDPQTFTIREEVPGFPNPDKNLANGRNLVTFTGKPLHLAFDLTSGPERAPVLLHPKEVETLKEYVGVSEADLYRYYKEVFMMSAIMIPPAVEEIMCLAAAYDAAQRQMLSKLDARIDALEQQGVYIPQIHKDQAAEIIGKSMIHVGSNADKANQSLIDFIEGPLFKVREFQTCTTDLAGLEAFSFPAQPYTVLEAGSDAPSSFQSRLAKAQATNARSLYYDATRG